MDEQRKYAYRYLLYRAMLDIRPLQEFGGRGWRAWNPIHWRREARRVRWAGALANWLHNLALYSAHDFRGFSEEWFWRDFESVRSRFPEYEMEMYLEEFERCASPAPEGSSAPGTSSGPEAS